jgi:geranylgeranyl diphosphate synthase, type II
MATSLEVLQIELQAYISSQAFAQEPLALYEPLDYMIALGGKRIRPLMVLLGHGVYSDQVKPALPAAMSVEVFHNFSLIHDDIMDEAPLRRGKATVHEKWNHNTAILAGDVMLVKAYQQLMHYEGDKLTRLLTLFNKTAIEVCEGQQIDMEFESRESVTLSEYLRMIELKTAVLLGCSLEMGAIVAGASEKEAEALYTYGRLMGIAFQLRDDYLDVYADPKKFGKQVGGDIIANKKTFLLIEALRLANNEQKEIITFWLKKEVFRAEEKVSAITQIFDELELPQLLQNKINAYAAEARLQLRYINGNTDTLKLIDNIAGELLVREN